MNVKNLSVNDFSSFPVKMLAFCNYVSYQTSLLSWSNDKKQYAKKVKYLLDCRLMRSNFSPSDALSDFILPQ